MKKLTTLIVALLSLNGIFAQNKGYYEQNARKTQNILVYSSKVEYINSQAPAADDSDDYIAEIVKNAIITDYQIYSNYTPVDFTSKETAEKLSKNPLSRTADLSDVFQAGTLLEAKYAFSIKTIIDKGTPVPAYSIDITIHQIDNNSTFNGYTSAIEWNRNEYIEYAHKEAVHALLPLTDITLTPLGEKLLLETKSSNLSLEEAQNELADINLQHSRTIKKSDSEVASKIVKIQHERAGEKVRYLTKQAVFDEDERIALQKRSDEVKNWIAETSAKSDKLIQEISNAPATDLSIINQINIIETRKQILSDKKEKVIEKIKLNDINKDKEKTAALEERKNRRPEPSEVDAFGTLNETARVLMQKDLINIDKKFEEEKARYKADTEAFYAISNDKIAKAINDDVRLLESKVYESNSITDEDTIFHIDYYDGDKHGWMYTLQFNFDGKTVYSADSMIPYKTLTGSKAPSTSELIVAKTREKYNSIIDQYSALYRNTKPFINAHVYYTVKSEDWTKPSQYKVEVKKIELQNLTNGKILDTIVPPKALTFEYFPVTEVDWRTTTMVAQEIKKIEDKKEEQKNIIERLDRQSRRFTWGGLILLPSVWNYYKTDNDSFQTLGYTMTLGITNHFYAGVSGEIGNIKDINNLVKDVLDKKDDSMDNLKDYEFKYTVVGQLGATYKLFDWMRVNIYGEYGKINKETGYGIGVSTDLSLGKFGILGGYTKTYDEADKWMDKFTLGFEFVF